MKKCIKPICVIITLCMTMLMFASCGNSEQLSFMDTLKKGMEITEGTQTAEFTFKIKADDIVDDIPQEVISVINTLGIDLNNIVFSLKTDTQFKKETEESIVNISYKLGVNDYSKLTDIIVKDNAMYINVKSIVNEIQNVAKAVMGDKFNFDIAKYVEKDYVKLDETYINENFYAKPTNVSGIQLTDEQSKQITDMMTGIIETITPSLQTAIDNLGAIVLSEKDGLQFITINNSNIADILKQIISIFSDNIGGIMDKVAETLESSNSEYAKYVDTIKQSKDQLATLLPTYVEKINSGIDELVKEMNDENVTFNITLGTGFNDSTFIIKGDVSFSADGASVSSSYNVTRTPNTFAGATVPSSFYETDELENSFNGLSLVA